MKLTKKEKIICGIIAILLAGVVILALLQTNLSLSKAVMFILNSCMVGLALSIPLVILVAIISWITEPHTKKPKDKE